MTTLNIRSPRVADLTLPPPSLKDNTADADRLVYALKSALKADVSVGLGLMRRLPEILRENRYRVRCILVRDRERHELVGAQGQEEPRPALGIAMDLGTTTVVLRLIHLADGAVLSESTLDNPQIPIAPDVLARVHHADTPGGLTDLHDLIIRGVQTGVDDLCASCRVSSRDIYLATVAGNTTMTHLFLGITPRWIIREPYIPAVNSPGLIRAADLGLNLNPEARVLVFPNVGSYFGGDRIAGILFSGMNDLSEVGILVDVGTNAEVILGNKDWLLACAGAAGPALEGGVARMGMRAGPGVIDTVAVDPETRTFHYQTIGGLTPRGMCGSGIIDLAAHLFLSGMLNIQGKLVPDKCGDHYGEADGMPYIVVVPARESATAEDLILSQADIDSLIRSKAAMYTILETLTLNVGMTPQDLTTFFVAGTFGSYIKPRSAITIGMIPDLPLTCFKTLGNSSLGGAAMALSHPDPMAEMDKIRGRITYIELNVNQELMIRFSAAKFLPHTEASLFPSVRPWG